ncbi:hypothetical protein TWF173_009426 [Orbilia oligospora]|uniref:Uncharacterized protein n=2 Tax=Orbilia oligospora TaxID=2813651 RepID=G1XDR5_ARTOA|nr:hypothetical protein AOL_s00079g450 [Orbilia oligospora ATCC 24927]EGX48811.1 hypothetical protein AOL_s00079g450 [Orbilia oligospora ATCC 24927]KAF3287326.1 hypothetical protein TWF970_007053 [Orbilia oligospora]KAF3310539.1 hypothetical protein TWF173_009426 [Orbilia oligospora]
MVLFRICNPYIDPDELPSTRTIPPQQPGQHEHLLRQSIIGKVFPEDVFQEILKYLRGNVMTAKEAKNHQETLIMERGFRLKEGLYYWY